MQERVGFVGLGIMGMPMARNLKESGYKLTVYNRTREKALEFANEEGTQVADNPKEVAEQSDVVIIMLPGPPEVREVVSGESGILKETKESSLVIDMSTSSPRFLKGISVPPKERSLSWSAAVRRTLSGRGRCLRCWAIPSYMSVKREPGRR